MHQAIEREQELVEAEFLAHFGEPMPSGDLTEWLKQRREQECQRPATAATAIKGDSP
jgi:hypothetical protein